MTPHAARQDLLEHPGFSKEVRLNDGSRIVVRSREHGLAAGDYRIVLCGRFDTHVAYRNIAAIRVPPRPGRGTRNR